MRSPSRWAERSMKNLRMENQITCMLPAGAASSAMPVAFLGRRTGSTFPCKYDPACRQTREAVKYYESPLYRTARDDSSSRNRRMREVFQSSSFSQETAWTFRRSDSSPSLRARKLLAMSNSRIPKLLRSNRIGSRISCSNTSEEQRDTIERLSGKLIALD